MGTISMERKVTTIGLSGDDDWTPGIVEDNEIYGYGGDDFLWPVGQRRHFGGGGNDVVCGGDDMDVLYGEDDRDIMYGNGGDDRLIGGAGDDQLYGGEDIDFLIGGSGNDALDGGSGEDTAHYGDFDFGVMVNLVKGIGEGGTAEGDMLAKIENVVGLEHDDELTGDQFANELHGGGGNDILSPGGGGADTRSAATAMTPRVIRDCAEGVVVSLRAHSGHERRRQGRHV